MALISCIWRSLAEHAIVDSRQDHQHFTLLGCVSGIGALLWRLPIENGQRGLHPLLHQFLASENLQRPRPDELGGRVL